jgi:hypothetical protein
MVLAVMIVSANLPVGGCESFLVSAPINPDGAAAMRLGGCSILHLIGFFRVGLQPPRPHRGQLGWRAGSGWRESG